MGNNIEINLIYFPVTTLGPGRRTGVWVQGCSRRCEGCISEHTWNHGEGKTITTDKLADEIMESIKWGADGVTISGGEPFEQYESLLKLLSKLRENGIEDILIYTGFEFCDIEKRFGEVLKYAAVIIDGRFVLGDVTAKVWKGSENQRMHIITKDINLIEKYNYYDKMENRKMQVVQEDDKVIVLGIPKQNDREEIINGN